MTGNELAEIGFKFDRVKYCCAGIKNEIYRMGEYELKVRPKYLVFQIRKRGNGITAYLPIAQLKAKLYELEILEKEVT